MQRTRALALALSFAISPSTLEAQRNPRPTPAAAVPAVHPAVRAALERVRADNEWTLQQQASICEIPAPPFREERRAAEMKRRFEELGLQNVRVDSIGNVIAERPGRGTGPVIIFSAHLDTVFPEATDVRVRREGTILRGPGIGDNCRGLAVLLAVARAMRAADVRTEGTIFFVANVGEEGPGNLRGVRYLFSHPPARIDYFVAVDGTGLGLTSRAVGSNRYRVFFRGPGGHSYGAFGMPNPIHALGRAIAKIADIQVPAEPKTTFNVGIIEGGTTVNTISSVGSMEVDLRSESPRELARLDSLFRKAVHEALEAEKARWPASRVPLSVEIESMGVRPAGSQPDTALIVRTAQAAARALGFESPTSASSTDANLPISLGIPAITLDGGGRGSGAHSLSEYYDDGDRGWLGPQWALLVITSLAGVR